MRLLERCRCACLNAAWRQPQFVCLSHWKLAALWIMLSPSLLEEHALKRAGGSIALLTIEDERRYSEMDL
jgi:hypothetical protein